ncbi:hypothetical protein EBT31_19755 [bacterium]|jgi:hypothetical protein|nr:hypothetical protein [bacterium]
MKKYRAKAYNEGGKMEAEQEIEVMNPDLMMAVKQIQAAVKAAGSAPMHYKVKACYYSED